MKDGYLFNISLRHEHNHRLFCAAALKKRDVSAETINNLTVLFQNGHSPSTALDTMKTDLQDQEGNGYIYAAGDRSICPDLQFCFRLEMHCCNPEPRNSFFMVGGISSRIFVYVFV